jgi:hypothetical protein
MNVNRRSFAVLPFAAWSGSLVFFAVKPLVHQRLISGATLSLVSLASGGNDVVSNVEALVIVVIWAFVCLLIVEPSKCVALSSFGRYGAAVYLFLLIYRIVLVADMVHAHAIDWWIWLLSLVNLDHRVTSHEIHPSFDSTFPWLSLVTSLLIGVTWYWLSSARTRTDDLS